MRLREAKLPILAALAAAFVFQAPAVAQREGVPAQRVANARAAADLRARLTTITGRISLAQRNGKITRARAAALHRQVARTRASMTRLSRQQGFVSAAELASYERTLGGIDMELDRRGVDRSYGNDMLPAAGGPTRGYGDDALPSAEVTAFRATNARLRYRSARIEHDARGCAIYRGIASHGHVRDEPLRTPDGRPICMRR